MDFDISLNLCPSSRKKAVGGCRSGGVGGEIYLAVTDSDYTLYCTHGSHWKERKLKTWKSPDVLPGRHKIHQSSLSFQRNGLPHDRFLSLLVNCWCQAENYEFLSFLEVWRIGTIGCHLTIPIMSTSLK